MSYDRYKERCEMEPTPVLEFEWPSWNDIGPLFELTCKNHPFLQWSTKHPTYRSLHYLGLDDNVEMTKENARFMFRECECPYQDLMVIGKED